MIWFERLERVHWQIQWLSRSSDGSMSSNGASGSGTAWEVVQVADSDEDIEIVNGGGQESARVASLPLMLPSLLRLNHCICQCTRSSRSNQIIMNGQKRLAFIPDIESNTAQTNL
jgi:hypothetical protein